MQIASKIEHVHVDDAVVVEGAGHCIANPRIAGMHRILITRMHPAGGGYVQLEVSQAIKGDGATSALIGHADAAVLTQQLHQIGNYGRDMRHFGSLLS